jgi:C4-dicarboxylate transporter/malic acid transport protein
MASNNNGHISFAPNVRVASHIRGQVASPNLGTPPAACASIRCHTETFNVLNQPRGEQAIDLESLSDAATEIGDGDEPAAADKLKRIPALPVLAGGARTRPLKQYHGWKRVIRGLTPSWFAVNMGTGIVSILLFRLPYTADWVEAVSYSFFVLNVLLFILFTVLSILRYTLYPQIWGAMIRHPAQSLFIGCFPTGLATIINMMILACQQFGNGWIYFTWALWWIDVFLSIATCLSMPFIIMHKHRPGLPNITAGFLLPIVPAIVASASGGVLADVLPNTNHALTTIVVSYILWGIGVFLTAIILALYFHRLTLHALPNREVIVSVLIPIGPLGQGSFAIQLLGSSAARVLPKTNVFAVAGMEPSAGGEILYIIGVFCGLMMWGFSAAWLFFAVTSILVTKRFPFNMGWWGFTFPLGVFSVCTIQLAENLDSDFFRVLAEFLSLTVVAFWFVVSTCTFRKVLTTEIWNAPDLKTLVDEQERMEASGNSNNRVTITV